MCMYICDYFGQGKVCLVVHVNTCSNGCYVCIKVLVEGLTIACVMAGGSKEIHKTRANTNTLHL